MSSWHLPGSLCFLLLVSWAVATAALPLEDGLVLKSSEPLMDAAEGKRGDLLTFLVSLYDWSSRGGGGGGEMPLAAADEPQFSKRDGRGLPNQAAPREKAPCKNFFWKTFSSC
ncbi:cortistatin-like [Sarcophilus harrisii]|uniref:cortistatin-like n=1 Tax=Sarcophilus harrisii TaxID=9305 RepID=UPI001301FAF4|nr:cortistatin-like [Sarcophilus harrisii]